MSEALRYLERKNCFIIDVLCDNSESLNEIKKLSFNSHRPVKITHSRGLRISMKKSNMNRNCKLFVSESPSKVREMAQQEIKVNEENFYSAVGGVGDGNRNSIGKICLSSSGVEIKGIDSNCSESQSNDHIKIPVIFVSYQPYIGEYEYMNI